MIMIIMLIQYLDELTSWLMARMGIKYSPKLMGQYRLPTIHLSTVSHKYFDNLTMDHIRLAMISLLNIHRSKHRDFEMN